MEELKKLMQQKKEIDEQVHEIKSLLGIASKSHIVEKEKYNIGKFVIVRCRDAGVHAGILVDYEGRKVVLKESRRLWYWLCKKGHTLSGVALHGVSDKSKIAGVIEKELILPEACEIIPTEKEAEESIKNAKEYNS